MAFENNLGVQVKRKHKDGATCEIPIHDELMNSTGVLHGGVIATIADEVAWWAILTALGSDRKMTTTELKVNYLRPIIGRKVIARGFVLKLGRTLAVTRIDIFDEKRKLAAHATVTYAMLS